MFTDTSMVQHSNLRSVSVTLQSKNIVIQKNGWHLSSEFRDYNPTWRFIDWFWQIYWEQIGNQDVPFTAAWLLWQSKANILLHNTKYNAVGHNYDVFRII